MNSSKSINVLAKISIVAALYVVITYAIAQ